MIRAFFFACGLFVTLCGGALACVDRVVLTDYAGARLRRAAHQAAATEDGAALRLIYVLPEKGDPGREVIDPPDWAAFGLLSAGGVTLLYSLAIPGRRKEPEGEGE